MHVSESQNVAGFIPLGVEMKTLSKSTYKTYDYRLKTWYQWSCTHSETKWNDEDLEQAVLHFIVSYQIDGKALSYVLQFVCALCYQFGADRIRTAKVREALKRYAYENGRPARKVKAIGLDEITAMVEAAKWQRDKTVLSVGWAGALRASELVAIRRNDLKRKEQGFELMITRSKTDQTGKGKVIPLPYYHIARMSICPARNLERYLMRQADLFDRSEKNPRIFPFTVKTVTRIIERSGKAAELPYRYSSHSLRRGLATTAALHSIDDRTIMRHGRWKSREVVDGYIEEGTLWQKTALDFLR